jgi:hypothetical protein
MSKFIIVLTLIIANSSLLFGCKKSKGEGSLVDDSEALEIYRDAKKSNKKKNQKKVNQPADYIRELKTR